LLLHAIVHPADIQDRDGGKLVLATMFGLHPFLRKLFADGGYQGPKFRAAQKKILPLLVTEIVVALHLNVRRPLQRFQWLRFVPNLRLCS